MESVNNREKRISYIVFGVYLLLLCWLVLFKFAIRAEDIPRLRNLNFIPFYYDSENSVHLREVVLNVLAFIPAGFYFSAIFSKMNILLAPVATALISFLFESSQWVFSIGASDITDLIMNTIGGLCGMLLFVIMGRIAGQHRMKIINALGIIIEFSGLFLITALTLANRS